MSWIHQPDEIVWDKYRITGILGRGGVAVTYSAIALETNSLVAIKVVSLRQLNNWKQVELFQREAEVLKQLSHPNIPEYIDYFDIETETDKAFYLVQQLAPGKSLHQLVESGWRSNEKEIRNIAQQVLGILSYLHSLNPPIIHRDIKPHNLIRSDEGKIYLVDFGAVQNTYYNTLMQGSTVVGTYGYMAPEQFRARALPATDLYSLGATLLYLLTHRSPAELPQDTLKLDFRSAVDISESFAEWLEKILEPDIEDRFNSADIALSQLFASKRKINRKAIATLFTTATLALCLIVGSRDYKWLLLSSLGFYPQEICDAKVLDRFLEQGGILNRVNTTDKICILSNSIRHDEIEVIENKLRQIRNVDEIINKLDLHNKNLMHVAVIRGDIDAIDLLIKYGGNIELENNLKGQDKGKLSEKLDKLLFYSIYKNNRIIIELTINLGIDLNGTNGVRLLRYAVVEEDIDLLKLAIENGAKANLKNKYISQNQLPLYRAVIKGNVDVVRLLIDSSADINIAREHITNSLFHVNSVEIAKLLIDSGADVNARDNRGRSTLFDRTSVEIAKLLINSGADVNIKDKQGKTALFYQVRRDNYNIAKLLIDSGADATVRDNDRKTALFDAVSTNMAELLIKNGDNIAVKATYDRTPLFDIASRSNIKLVQLLIDYGADATTRDSRERTPLFGVTSTEVAKLLIKNGANVNAKSMTNSTPLSYAVGRGNKDVAKFLIKHGAGVNVRDDDGKTPLFSTVRRKRYATITKLLIESGAEVNVQDNSGKTPLFYAVMRARDATTAKLLIDFGANTNIKDKNGETALFYAAYLNNIEIAKLLVESGANVNVQSNNGETALHIAVVNMDRELASLLIDRGANIDSINLETINRLYKLPEEDRREVKSFLKQYQNTK